MSRSIYERVRAAQAKATHARQAPERAAQTKLNRQHAAAMARDIKRESGITRAIETGFAHTLEEQRAIDYDLFGICDLND